MSWFNDRRRQDSWFANFRERDMTVTTRYCEVDDDGEPYEDQMARIPVKYEVCETCDGKGKHVNPNIDDRGLSADDFAEDPDFAEDYFSGNYDVPCNECGGNRVALVIDDDKATPEQQQWITDYYAEIAADRRTQWYEMGCPE